MRIDLLWRVRNHVEVCRLTASNLTPEEKDSVKRVVNILGGQYSVKMGFSNTHLIVPYAAGDKYEGAVRYNVQPVTCNWIIDVARAGPFSFRSQ